MRDLIDTIRLLLTVMFLGAWQDCRPLVGLTDRYLHGLLQLASVAIFLPIPFALLGIVKGWSPLTACAGLWCTGFLAILLFWGTPIGILLEALLRSKSGAGTRYISIARGILLWEAILYWFLSVVPVGNHPTSVPLFALSLVCLLLMAKHWGFEGNWLRPILWYSGIVVLLLCITLFFFPRLTVSGTQSTLGGWLGTTSSVVGNGFKATWVWLDSGAWKTPGNALQAIGLLVGVGLLIWFVRNRRWGASGGHGGGHSTSHGGHEGGPSVIVTLGGILLVLALFVELVAAYRVVHENGGTGRIIASTAPATATTPTATPVALGTGTYVPVTLTSNWVPFEVGRGMAVHWEVDGHVLYRVNAGPIQEDWPGRQGFERVPAGPPYTNWFRAKGPGPVRMKVYLTPYQGR